MNSFEKFSEDKLPDGCICYNFLKDDVSMENIAVSMKKMNKLVKKIIYMLPMFAESLK